MPSLKKILSTHTDPIINPRNGAVTTSVAGIVLIAVLMLMVESEVDGMRIGEDGRQIVMAYIVKAGIWRMPSSAGTVQASDNDVLWMHCLCETRITIYDVCLDLKYISCIFGTVQGYGFMNKKTRSRKWKLQAALIFS